MKKENTIFGEVLTTVTKYFLILVLLVLFGIFLSSFRVVDTGTVALVLRFGHLVGDSYEEQVHGPGLLFTFPYLIDEVVTVPTGSVIEQSVTTHYTSEDSPHTRDGGYVITGDQSVAVLSASVKYVIDDPVAYALRVKDVPAVINACVSSAMLNEAARVDVDHLLTDGKDSYAAAVLRRASEKLAEIGVGVTLTTLEMTQIGMPNEVRDIYNQVNAAAVEASTLIQEAYQYREKLLPQMQSDADSLVAAAHTQYASDVSAANTKLAEFWGVREEYENNPAVVRARIFTEKIIRIMQRIGRVRVVQDGETNIFINP